MQLFEASKSGGRVRAQVALMEEEASKLTSEKSDAVKANTFKAANRLDNRDKMTDAPTTGAIHARSPSVAGYANNANDDSRSSDGRRVQGGHAQAAAVKLEPGTSAAGVTERKSNGGNSSGLHESERSTNAPPPMYTERQVKPAPPRLSGPVHFKAPPQECGHDRLSEVPPCATKLDALREAAGERSRATYAAPVPPPPTTAHTATDGGKFTLPMARPAQPRVA